jgi:hypothetical protein
MSALYEGCWHKLDRAKHHLDELQDRVRAWCDFHTKPPYTFRKEFNRKRNLFTFHVVSVEKVPVEWSLITGDVLTNYRAALDYLAYETPHRRHEVRTFFPVAKKKRDFKGQVNGGMPGILPKHRTIIQAYQPYKWRSARDRHPFALLNTFVNRDKHREIQPVFTENFHSFHARVGAVNDFAVSRVEPGRVFGRRHTLIRRFEPGAEVARVYGKKTGPNPNVVMGFYSPVSVAFENGAWFPEALADMGQAITRLFREIEPIL